MHQEIASSVALSHVLQKQSANCGPSLDIRELNQSWSIQAKGMVGRSFCPKVCSGI